MRVRLPWLLLSLLVCSAMPRTAAATPLTWEFSGLVDNVSGFGWDSVATGDPFSWTVTFDTDTPNALGCPPGSGTYSNAITHSTLNIGQFFWTGGAGTIEANAPDGACGAASTGVSFREFNWTGSDVPGVRVPVEVVATLFFLLPSDGSIPMLPPASAFVQINAPTRSAGGPSSTTTVSPYEAYADPVPVPEPATLALVGSGVAFLFRKRLLGRRS